MYRIQCAGLFRQSRYVHRIAISNGRLVCLEDGKVTFVYKDYRYGRKKRIT
ncbi:MAG: transposase [Candidatus Riflebacteria bacterium]|nr:transposase [Candidatus Riflebacteria bacterium]